MSNTTIHNTDIIEYLTNYNGPKFHAVLSDPPYGLSFMNKKWDKYTPLEYQQWVTQWSSLLLKHLYPGAVCMFFGGTRTYHRLATGLEDAGFEIFDSMVWCYGSGFPKSYNISKGIDKKLGLEREIVEKRYRTISGVAFENKIKGMQGSFSITKPNSLLAEEWNGYGTALKPAFEPIVLCRKPKDKLTYVDCVLDYGTGGLNVDGSRIEYSGPIIRTNRTVEKSDGTKMGYFKQNGKLSTPTELGRFPANLGLICNCECDPCECDYNTIGDSARFFYTAKTSRKERNLGLDALPELETQVTGWSGDGMPLRQNGTERKMPKAKNTHPTVKPIKLTEYLSKLLLPPIENSSILIPFSGSGSEVIGAMLAKWNVITALEIDIDYCNIAENRIQYWKQFGTYEEATKGK